MKIYPILPTITHDSPLYGKTMPSITDYRIITEEQTNSAEEVNHLRAQLPSRPPA